VLTVVAWFVSRAVVGLDWAPARNPFTFEPSLWARVDSFNYIHIAQHGSNFGRCAPGSLPFYFHQYWCGTAAWLPGYPWAIRLVSWTGMSLLDAALLVSWLAMAAALFLVWFGWGRQLPAGRALALLVLVGVFPGSVYDYALYPTSLALAFVLGSLLAATRERFLPAAVLMTLAGLCYPSAWFAAIGMTVGLVIVALPLGPSVVARRALWGLAGLASLVVLGWYDLVSVNRVFAYFDLQHQADNSATPGLPVVDFARLIFRRDTTAQKQLGSLDAALLAVQAIVAIALAGAATGVAVMTRRRKAPEAALVYPAAVGLVVAVVLVLIANAGAWNRSVVLAAPCVVCLRRFPLPLLCAILVAVGALTAIISRPFFLGLP
jgi:hypothetical protein